MFSYSVKFVCGIQNPPSPTSAGNQCTPVRQGAYATEINIHNFQRDKEAAIEKFTLLLIHNDSPLGLEPRFVKATPFAKIVLPANSATMDHCCNLAGPLKFAPGQLNVGFLEIVSSVELNVTAVYTATDLKSGSISIDLQTITARVV